MKKFVSLVLALSLLLCMLTLPVSATEGTVYVASYGLISNAGTESAPVATLAEAFAKNPDKIVLLDNTVYALPPAYTKPVIISGKTADVQLSIADGSSLAGPTTLDNLTITSASAQAAICCKGNALTITDSVTCSNTRLALFGGMHGSSFTGDTHLNLYGGTYNYIYGGNRGTAGTFTGNAYVNIGGNANISDLYTNGGSASCEVYGGGQCAFVGNAFVTVTAGAYKWICGGNKSDTATFTGNTYVTVGGNVNAGEGIDDAASNISKLTIFGGGTGPVAGSTHVTLEGNAVCKFIYGAGSGTSGTVRDSTNVHIKGGKVMNAFSGSNAAILNCNLNLTMTGGIAEALFGGSSGVGVTGNANVKVLGGEVYRRIYSGCYNDWKLTYSTSCYVTGNTFLILGKDATIINKNALSSDNRDNMGIFAGSRLGAQSKEVNTLVYLDGASAKHKSNVGDVSGWSWAFKSCQDYTITATGGGMIDGTTTAATISIKPDAGYAGFVGSTDYSNQTYVLPATSATVDFKKTFKIESVTATVTDNKPAVEVHFWAENALGETNPRLLAVVYDADGKMVATDAIRPETDAIAHTFNLDCALESDKTYTVKAFMWKNQTSPILEAQTTTFIN